MTIDEAIEKEKIMSTKGNILFSQRPDIAEKHNKDHKQIAEWLEELKELRKIKEDYTKGMQTSYATFMYNKAIDEAIVASANAICIGCGYLDGTQCTYKGCNCGVSKPMIESVKKALEQLKEGGADAGSI